MPLSELRLLDQHSPLGGPKRASDASFDSKKATDKQNTKGRRLNNYNSIRFVRHRMLYRKPDLNAKGQIAFALPQIRKSADML